MPSVVKTNPTVGKERSTRASGVREPVASDVPRKRSQLLVSSESSHNVKSVERGGVAASKSSSANSRTSKLVEKSTTVRPKVDLATHAATAAGSVTTSRVVCARNPAVRSTGVKPHANESAKSDTCSNSENRDAAKTTRTSGAMARLSAAKTAVHRMPVVETSRRENVSASNTRKSTVSASVTSGVKHEALSSRSGRVAAASQGKANGTAASLASKKTQPQLRQANGTSLTTGRTSLKRSNALPRAVDQEDKQDKAGDKSSLGKCSASSRTGKLAELSSASAVEDSVARSDLIAVSVSVDDWQGSLPPDDTSGTLHDDCIVSESCTEVVEASHQISYINSESPPCESLRSNLGNCEHVLESAHLTVPFTHLDDTATDLEETSVCDISLNSCRSDCSASLFHSACSSVIGSISDMKCPSLNGSLENDNLGTWSGSNSVSMESLRSSAGYCTPSEQDNCEAADCTVLNTDDLRDELMDGAIRFYVDDSSTTDAEGDKTPSPAGQRLSAASPAVVAGDTSPADRSPSTTATDSNANIVDVVVDVQPAASCRETVAAEELNGDVEEAPSDIDEQTVTLSSPLSSEGTERLSDWQSSDARSVKSTTLPRMTAAERHADVEKAGLSDSECSVDASSVMIVSKNSEPGHCLRDLPDSCSASLPALSCSEALSRHSLSSQASPKPVDGQSADPADVPPVDVSQSIPVKGNSYTSTQSPSDSSLKATDADARVREDTTNKDDCEEDCSSSACQVPVVSLSCSSVVDRLCSYVPSPGPLTQMYGGQDIQVMSDCASETSSPSTSSSVRSSLLTYSPLKVGGDVSEITAKISVARSCSRNAMNRPLTVGENFFGRRTDAFRSFRTADSRSTPWLVAGERSMENLRSPSLGLGLSHSLSVSGSLADSSSVASSSSPSVRSSASMMPLVASRSSSLMSSDGSTLHTSTLVPDNSLHSSLASLSSVSSSIYSNVEEKHLSEVRRLKQELELSREKVGSLSTQLSINIMMVNNYEQNIESLTKKLKNVTGLLEQKDAEVAELRSAAPKSRGSALDVDLETIPDCVSLHSFRRKSSNASTLPAELRTVGGKPNHLIRHTSCDSVDSINSQSSTGSLASQQSALTYSDKKKLKKKNWIKNSLAKAFSRKKSGAGKSETGTTADSDSISILSDISVADSAAECLPTPAVRTADCILMERPFQDAVKTCELEDQLHERDVELTESRLQSLASSHHIEQLQEKVSDLEKEVSNLKVENRNLKRLLQHQGSSESAYRPIKDGLRSSMSFRERGPTAIRPPDFRLSLAESSGSSCDLPDTKLSLKYSLADLHSSDCDSIYNIKVVAAVSESAESTDVVLGNDQVVRYVGELCLANATGWEALDSMVSDVFMEYLEHVDPGSHLGLDEQSISGYWLSETFRTFHSSVPDTMPKDCITDNTASIQLCIKDWQNASIDLLVFETLVPKALLQQYVSLLMDSKRLVFSGLSGTGKSYLATRLAQHIVLRCHGKDAKDGDIVTFVASAKNIGDIQQYISQVVRNINCEPTSQSGHLPTVIVIDNLHHIASLADVFSSFVSAKSAACPHFIGTMNPTRKPSNADLQLRQSFRWVLLSPSLEPVSRLLSRHLRRALTQLSREGGAEKMKALRRVIEWLQSVWEHVNKTLSQSACIGPALFLTCPMDVEKSQKWFGDLWNYTIVPYLSQVNKESAVRGKADTSRSQRPSITEDPTAWVLQTYPWPLPAPSPLMSLKPECDDSRDHSGYSQSASNTSLSAATSADAEDQLLAMLLKLQEVTAKPSAAASVSSCSAAPASELDGRRSLPTAVHSAV